jgi:Copper type II ascorbate-dependent monooxygenase, C-terminal domain
VAADTPQKVGPPPTFYRNVAPILQDHCQTCHRSGEIAPFSLVTYKETKSRASAIKQATQAKDMPPWFADPHFGKWADDPSLTTEQIEMLTKWVDAGAPAGDPRDAPPAKNWSPGWDIPPPDVVVRMPKSVPIPSQGEVDYTYEIVPTGFTTDRWIQMSQIRPSSPEYVHHAVVYIRPPDSKWLRGAPVGTPFTANDLSDPVQRRNAHWTDTDMLLVYAPGSSPDQWADGMAKFVPAGSDLVFQMHYTTNGHAGSDQTAAGIVFAKSPVTQRVMTLQLTNSSFLIPPRADNFRVEVHGTLPNDALLLNFFPHMHLRGKRFEYNIVHQDKTVETLLRVNYDFHWQLSYRLAEPRFLKAGTELQAVAWFDNSENNPHNPDPDAMVKWGDQTRDEMMVGFFDVAVPAGMDKPHFFLRGLQTPR